MVFAQRGSTWAIFFFKGLGLLQFQVYGLFFSGTKQKKSFDRLLEFLIFNKNKKEIWLCSMNPKLEGFCCWLERAWSESLFNSPKSQPPLLRHIRCYDLQHAFVEELMAKKDQICLWALDGQFADLEDQKAYNDWLIKKLKALTVLKKIPFLYYQLDLKNPDKIFNLIFLSYKILFVFSDFFKGNIFSNQGVDFFKVKKI